MSFSSSASAAVPNVTPLIDVLLVLLIIFMVILPAAPLGLTSNVPSIGGSDAGSQTNKPLILRVLAPIAQGRGATYQIQNRRYDLDGLSQALLLERSRSVLWIEGDSSLEYQAIAETISRARQAGFQTIGLLPRRH